MERIQIIRNQLAAKKKSYVDSAIDWFKFDDLLSKEEAELRRSVREFAEKVILPKAPEYVEKAAFPEFVLQPLRENMLASKFISKPHGEGLNAVSYGVTCMELARGDLSCATFFMVQTGLAMATIELLGSEEQKAKYLPRMAKMELISGWGLTERDIGSDASSLTTTVTKVPGGYKINGNKRWIGNGNRDLMVVWARNTETKKVQGFIVNMKSEGVKSEVIKHKLALRMVQNCQITFKDVFVPDEDRLPKCNDFSDINKVLLHSRVVVNWAATGVALGVYDHVIKYMSERKQFGVPISSFQLSQEKLARMMGTIQAMLLLCIRITRLYDEDKATIGQVGLCKAWNTRMGREVVALGREMLGGNGIIIDNYVMKAFVDMEVAFTYEGTYDINALVAGRELTGVAAFKASGAGRPPAKQ